ncbi:MAG: TonB-dependent receptor [Candidatus Acidiferrales bacterium]
MRYVAICFALLVSACTVFAQTGGTGSIQGTVSDPSGAVVSGAAVEAVNNATGTKTDTVTTDAGVFVIPQVLPGTYTVTVTASGFQTLKQEHVIVDALQTVSLNPKLQVGAATQYVTVSSQPTMLQSEDSHLGESMDNNVYDSLPLAMVNNQARDPAFFASLVVGVTDTSFQPTGTDLNSFNGGQQFQNEIYIEGLPITSAGTGGDTRNVSFGISVEAIEQFQVETTGSAAMYEGQGVENYVIKSGGNDFHGGVFEYARNTDFDAKGFFGTTTPVEHQNEFGGTFGGPIKRNKAFFFGSYDGYRFQTDIPDAQQNLPTTQMQMGDFSQLLTLTPEIPIYKNVCTGGTCTSTEYQCPTTSTNATNAGKFNIIPGSPACPVSGVADPLAPASQFLQSFLPAPQNGNLSNNYLAQGLLTVVNQDTTTEKVDYNLNDRNRLFVVYSFGRYIQPTTGSFTAGTSELPVPYLQARTVLEHVSTWNAHETFTLSPNVVNDLGFEYSRLLVPELSDTQAGDYPTKAGLTGLPPGIASEAFPGITFSGGSELPTSWDGTNANVSTEAQNTYTAQDNLSWLKNRHHFTFGFQWQALEDNDNNPLTGSLAAFTFSNTETSCVQISCGSTGQGTAETNTGSAYASYLLGLVDGSTITEDSFAESGGRYKDYAPYVEDDIKVSSRLTFNLGLRWDIWSPYKEQYNRESFFNPNITNPLVGLPGALEFAGYGNFSCDCSTVVHTDLKNLGPRVGLAYRIGDKTVVRAFYGIFYAHAGGIGGRTDGRQGLGFLGYTYSNSSSGAAGAPAYDFGPVASGGTGGIIPGGALTPPFITPGYGTGAICGGAASGSVNAGCTAAAPGTAAIGSQSNTSVAMAYANPLQDGIPPSYQDASFNIQHSFTPNLTLTVGWAGSFGRHLAGAGVAGPDTNQIPTTYLPIGAMLSQPLNPSNAVTEAAALRTALTADGIAVPAWAAASCTVCEPFPFFSSTLGQALKPYPQYLSLSDPWNDVGNSDYEALQISLNRRTSRGLTFMANFTWSKELDDLAGVRYPGLDNLEMAPGAIDRPIVAQGTIIDQLPFGTGHMISSQNHAVNAIIGNWQVVSVFTFASGAPLSVTASCTGDGIIDASCYPNINAGATSAWATGLPNPGALGTIIGTIPNGCMQNSLPCKDTQFLSPGVFSNPTPGTYGNASRMAPLNLFGFNTWDLDLSIRRVFPIRESWKFTLQADAFNLPNIVNFSAPTVGVFSATAFGTITSQANNPRKLQLSGRFDF